MAPGVVVAMETAELVHRLGLCPQGTIRLIGWMNEEMGATGRDAYAKDHAAEIPNHSAAIESDSGAEHPLGFRVKISNQAVQELSPVQQVLTPIGTNLLDQVSDSPALTLNRLLLRAYLVSACGRTDGFTSLITTRLPDRPLSF